MIACAAAEVQRPSVAILRAVPRDLFAEKEQFIYEVEVGWPGMPRQTKPVDLGESTRGVGWPGAQHSNLQ